MEILLAVAASVRLRDFAIWGVDWPAVLNSIRRPSSSSVHWRFLAIFPPILPPKVLATAGPPKGLVSYNRTRPAPHVAKSADRVVGHGRLGKLAGPTVQAARGAVRGPKTKSSCAD